MNNNDQSAIERFRTAVTGASYPAGAELVKLLTAHPMCELTAVSSPGYEGRPFGEAVPLFAGRCDLPVVSEQELIEAADIVFNADPYLDAQSLAAACINGRSVLIDLSSDFRLNDQTLFAQWHGGQYLYPALHDAALYCVPELARGQLAGKVLVSCPGPVANAAILALAPLLYDGLIYPDSIVISADIPAAECCSARDTAGFAGTHNSLRPYLTGEYPETGEIESFLSAFCGSKVRVTVLTSAVPVDRGLMVTCCARTHSAGNEQNLRAAYEKMYASEYFVRLLPRGAEPSTSYSDHTNFCDISLTRVERTGSMAAVCCMDYYMKGSAGNAVQLMNSLLNMPEYTGLEQAFVSF